MQNTHKLTIVCHIVIQATLRLAKSQTQGLAHAVSTVLTKLYSESCIVCNAHTLQSRSASLSMLKNGEMASAQTYCFQQSAA